MTRRMKILCNTALIVGGLLLLLFAATITLVQTDQFRNYVREKIISATEEGTGGRVEIGSFAFDWTRLHAVITDFVIHGNEPAGAPPFVRVSRVETYLRLFTRTSLFDLAYLGIERPALNLIVFA